MFTPNIRNISTWNFYFLTYDDGKYRIDGIFIAIYCLNGFLHPMGRLWDIMSTDKTLTNKMSTDKMSNRQNVDKKGKKFISRLDISMNKIFFFQKWSNHFQLLRYGRLWGFSQLRICRPPPLSFDPVFYFLSYRKKSIKNQGQ